MPHIPLTTRQYAHFARLNAQITELSAQRTALLETLLDASGLAEKNVRVEKILPDRIEYTEQAGPQLAQE
jgi:hypothetical protein